MLSQNSLGGWDLGTTSPQLFAFEESKIARYGVTGNSFEMVYLDTPTFYFALIKSNHKW